MAPTKYIMFLLWMVVDWVLVRGVKFEKWENEADQVVWKKQDSPHTTQFPDFDDTWHMNPPDIDNSIPQFPDQDVPFPNHHQQHRHQQSELSNERRKHAQGLNTNGVLEPRMLGNQEVDSIGEEAGDVTDPWLQVSDEILSSSIESQEKQFINTNTGDRDQSPLQMNNKRRRVNTASETSSSSSSSSSTIHQTSRNHPQAMGRADSLLGHFHGPHFGMIDHASLPKRPPVKGSHSVEGTFLWAVGLFGSVENGAVVLTAIFSRKFKKPLHILVGTLATTDLFISLIYIPSYTYFLLEGDTNFVNEPLEGEIAKDQSEINSHFSFCNISRSIFVEIASVTLTIKALIALYLYILTRSREFAKQVFSPRNTLIFIGIAWCVNFVMLFLPSFLGHGKVDFYPNEFVCLSKGVVPLEINEEDETLTFIYSFTALSVHVIELTLICACFIKVHNAIIRGKLYSDTHREGDKKARINYTRATKITVLVFTSFLVCWLPIYIINMIDPEHQKLPDDVHHLVMDLLLLKSAINPTIYIYGIRSLRHEMRLVCMCKCRLDEKTAKEEMAKALQSSSYFDADDSKSTGIADVI